MRCVRVKRNFSFCDLQITHKIQNKFVNPYNYIIIKLLAVIDALSKTRLIDKILGIFRRVYSVYDMI